MVVEFKRPQRDDYTDNDNPLQQVLDQIRDIRTGQFKNDQGRPISTANDRIPAFAYIICDITPALKQVLVDRDAKATPDGLSYYGYHVNHGVYYEVIDYGRLLTDAKRRNKVFFDKLNHLASWVPITFLIGTQSECFCWYHQELRYDSAACFSTRIL